MIHIERWITSYDIRIGRFEIILHKRAYWGSLLHGWGWHNSGGLIATPFGGFYVNW